MELQSLVMNGTIREKFYVNNQERAAASIAANQNLT
jgi:hypothetical protein